MLKTNGVIRFIPITWWNSIHAELDPLHDRLDPAGTGDDKEPSALRQLARDYVRE
jgi:hypothetical protein